MEQPNASDKIHLEVNFMSTKEIISFAQSIVKREPVKAIPLKGWELDELMWWIKNLGGDLL